MEKIQDYILKDLATEEKKEEKPKKKSEIEYEVVIENETDFVIERKTARTSSVLAVIVSQTPYQAYVKRGDEITELTSSSYATFFRDLEDSIELEKCQWINTINKGKNEGEKILNYLRTYAELAKHGLSRIADHRWNGQNSEMEILAKQSISIAKAYKKMLAEHYAIPMESVLKREVNHAIRLGETELKLCLAEMGEDNFKKLLQKAVDRGLVVNFNYGYTKLLSVLYDIRIDRWSLSESAIEKLKNMGNSDVSLDFEIFSEYILSYEREGYFSVDALCSDWADTLTMQKDIFHKIKEKYPENLASAHARMSVKKSLCKEQIDAEKFEQYYEKNQDLEWHNDKYCVKVPKTTEEIVDEAMQQNNCLRSYISRVADGETKVVFLRKLSDKDCSYITVQVSNDDTIVQVKGKNNRNINFDEKEILRRWCDSKKLNYGEVA